MNNNHNVLYAFIGGAIAGAATALLLAPEKGIDMRTRIKEALRRRGILASQTDIDELVEQLTIEHDD